MNYDEKSSLYPERSSGKSFPVTTSLEKALIVIVAIAVAVGIALTIYLIDVKKTNNQYRRELNEKIKESNMCLTSACLSEASNLMKSLEMEVDPCTDFYSFVCGNWIKNNYLITSLESQFTKLTRIILLRVKGILEDLETEKNLPEHQQKTKSFYKSCMDEAHRKNMGTKELLSDLKNFGGWPIINGTWSAHQFDWADLMIELFKNGYISSMFFTFKVDVDAKNTSRTLIAVHEPSLGLTRRDYYNNVFDELKTVYKTVIFKLAKHLQPGIDKEKSTKEIEEAFEIENKIANLSEEINMKYPENYYHIQTLAELEAFAPKIPWKKILQNILPPNTELTSEERIMVTSPTLIRGLNALFEKMNNEAGKRILANYMFYRVVLFAANYLSRPLHILVSSIKTTDAALAAEPWEICTKITMDLFSLPLTASYVARYMNNRTREQLRMMFEDTRNSLMDNIRNAKWVDEETKKFALVKVQKMKVSIAFEDEIMENKNLDSYYKNVNITDDYFGNVKQLVAFRLRHGMEGLHEKPIRFKWTDVDHLLTANAYYRPTENSIIIPVGVLQDTIFAAERPNYINYGSLGMIIGHELTHAFDSIGSLYDDEGSYRMWWSNSSWEEFEEKRKCYEEQYNNYYLAGADSYVNGTLTLAENIADNGGLHTAYNAYKALLKRIGSEKSLPGVRYNEKQMFWISFASVWCRKQTDYSVWYGMKHSVHTPSKYRVIGSLSNMKEFSQDFGCKLNSTMNPTSRCVLWE